jgi:50S ribosomal protein L16 3-hydroxylase
MARPAIEIRARKGRPLGMPPARFLHDYWQKRPLLIRQAFPDFTPPLSPDDLAGLACMDGALSRIVVRQGGSSSRSGNGRDPVPGTERMDHRPRRNDGKWSVLNGPFDDATFGQMPDKNWALLVQDVDKWDADTAALLQHFSYVPSWRIDDVMISYAVTGGGVGAHVDQYDVFLLQGHGRRRWAIDTRPDAATDFRDDVELRLLRRFHPDHEWVLEPGDMLYLPPGIPHDGVAVGECMTFSIGMRAPAASELLIDFAMHVADTLPESRRFADPDLAPARNAGEIDTAALRRARRALGPTAAMLDDDAFADWFGGFITRYRVAQNAAPRKRPIDPAFVAKRLPHARLERDPWTRSAWLRRGRDARLYVAGQGFDAPLGWARALAGNARELDGNRLMRLPQQVRGIALLASLIDAGHFRLQRD